MCVGEGEFTGRRLSAMIGKPAGALYNDLRKYTSKLSVSSLHNQYFFIYITFGIFCQDGGAKLSPSVS
jgi:hypothetical protein